MMNCLIGFFNGLHRCFSQIDKKILGIVLLLGLFLNGTVSGATYVWTGSGGDNNWTTIANWKLSDGTAASDYPKNSADIVYIRDSADITLDSDIEIDALSLGANGKNSSFTVTISGSNTLKVSGTTALTENAADKGIVTYRPTDPSASADQVTTLNLNCNVEATNLSAHSGGNVTIGNGATAKITNVNNLSVNNSVASVITVNGTLESTAISLSSNNNQTLVVGSTGSVSAETLIGSAGSVTNNGKLETKVSLASGLVDKTNSSGLLFSGTNDNVYWSGAVSVDATDDANWTLPKADWETKTVNVVSGVTNMPVLSSGTLECNSLKIQNGASFSQSDGTLTIKNALELEGTGSFSADGGTVQFSGTSVSFTNSGTGSAQFYNLNIGSSSDTSGTVALNNGFSVSNYFECYYPATIGQGSDDIEIITSSMLLTEASKQGHFYNTVTLGTSGNVTFKGRRLFFEKEITGNNGNLSFGDSPNATDAIDFRGNISGINSFTVNSRVNFKNGLTKVNAVNQKYGSHISLSDDSAYDVTFECDSFEVAGVIFDSNVKKYDTTTETFSDVAAITASKKGIIITNASNSANAKIKDDVFIKTLTLNGNADVSKSINTSGKQTYSGYVTLSGDVTLSSAGGSLNFDAAGKIISNSHKLVVSAGTGTPQTISFNGSFYDAADLKISGNAVIQGSNTFTSLVIDNTSFNADTTVSFQGGTGFKQTIGFLSAKAGDSNTITLTATGGDKWNADFTAAPGKNNFKNARISNSESTKKIYLSKEDAYINEGSSNSTINWFDVPVTYYWIGTSSSNWEVVDNWKSDDGTGRTDPTAWPDFELGTSVIVIDTDSSGYDLDTATTTVTDIKIKSLEIPDGKRIKIGTCTVSTTEDFIIKGTLALDGTQAANPLSAKAGTGSPDWGDDSTIEYYGAGAKDILSVDGNGKFNNLHVSAGDLTLEKEATVKKFTNDAANATETVFAEKAKIDDFNSSAKGTVTFKNAATISTSVTNYGKITLTEGLFTAPDGSSLGIVNVVGETSFSGGFTFEELNISSSTAGFTVKFPAGKKQNVKNITCKGTSTETITLQSDTDGSEWLVKFGTKPVETNFKYTIVKDSESEEELELAQIAENIQDAQPSNVTTRNWFSQSFYWYGSDPAKDGKWTTPGNWKQKPQYSLTTEFSAVGYPDFSSGTSKIFIMAGANADDILNLSSDTATESSIKVESIVVSPLSASNITADFGKTSVEVTATVANTGITNNGKIRLQGVDGQTITGTMINGTDSTVEYYGTDIKNLIWDGDSATDGKQFENIEFAENSVAVLTEKFIVSKNATFLGKLTSAEDNAISGTLDIGSSTVTAGNITLSGENSFGGNITITDAGKIDFSSGSNSYASGKTVTITKAGDVILNGNDDGLTLVSGAECASLNIKCPATIGTVTTTAGQTYEKDIKLGSDTILASGDDIVFGKSGETDGKITSDSKTLTVNAGSAADTKTAYFYGGFADSAKLTLTGNAEIYGSNEFDSLEIDNSSVTSATSVKFEGGKNQTIGTISAKGNTTAALTLESTGSEKWNVYFSTTPTNSDFEYAVIKDSKSVDSDFISDKELNLFVDEKTVTDFGLLQPPKFYSTKNWFARKYYWIGEKSSSWLNASGDDWAVDAGGTVKLTAGTYPDYQYGLDDIEIVKGTAAASAPFILNLGDDINSVNPVVVNSFTVDSGTIVDLGTCSVTSGSIINNGCVRIGGNQTITIGTDSAPNAKVSDTPSSTDTFVNSTTSVVEYYGTGISKSAWGKVYANLEFGTGASGTISENLDVSGTTLFANGAGNDLELSGNNTFTGEVTLGGIVTTGGSLVQAGNITLSGENKFSSNINIVKSDDVILSGKNDFGGDIIITEAGNVTFSSGSNSYASGKTVTITKAKDVILNGNDNGLTLFSGASCASLNIKCPATIGNVTTTEKIAGTTLNETQLYEKTVTLSTDSKFTGAADDLIHFCGTVNGGTHSIESVDSDFRFDDDVTDITDLTSAAKTTFAKTSGTQLISSSGDQTYNGDVEKLNETSDLSLSSKTVTVAAEKSVNVEGNVSVTTTENFILEGKNPVSATGSMTVTNTGYFLAGKKSSITAKTFLQNGDGNSQIGGKIIATDGKIKFKTDVYVYDASEFNSGSNSTNFGSEIFMSASGKKIIFDSETKVEKNFALFSGEVELKKDLTAEYDIILLNGTASTMDNDTVVTLNSGVSGLFSYLNTNRSDGYHAVNSLTAFPTSFPDGSALDHSTYASKMDVGVGITISALQNFYDNGVDLNPAGAWNLVLKDNGNQLNAFAEIYNATISNCSANFALAAAENCDGGNNTNVFFSRPALLENDSSKERELAGVANLSGTYTVYDDVIRVEFVDSISKASIKIENSNNEISRAITNNAIKYKKNGTLSPFAGAFVDANCTVSTDGKGDISVFFIKTSDSNSSDYKWNTDADGQNAFKDSSSTDSNGVHHTDTVPVVDIVKALSDLYESLRDEHKNRIDHITGANAFDETSDRASPALIGVFVGQELHVPNTGTPESQPEYDAHNFIEFMYSEKVEISTGSVNMPIAGTDCVNVTCDSVTGAIPNSSTRISVAGLGSMAGSISAFNKTSGSATPHALYRTFSMSSSGATYQPYRIRVSIAGRVDGTYDVSTPTPSSFHNFVGCIDSATTPSGKVTRVPNLTIKDDIGNPLDQNSCDYYNNSSHSNDVTVNTLPAVLNGTGSSLYGSWDTRAPTYAPYFLNYHDWKAGAQNYEVIGSVYSNSTFVENIEFHFFDNTPTYTEENRWIVKQGWTSSGGTVVSGYPDTVGGSRSFGETLKTSGGIRRSSLAGANNAFTYAIVGSSAYRAFGSSKEITQNVRSLLHVDNQETKDDSLYITIPLNPSDTNLPLSTLFNVKYNPSAGYVTDLAGNRLRETKVIQTIDVTPPAFVMSLAPIGHDFAYFIFTKQLAGKNSAGSLVPIPNLSTADRTAHFESLKNSLKVLTSDSSATDLEISNIEYISSSKPKSYTVLKFTFNRSVNLSDVEKILIKDSPDSPQQARNIFGKMVDNTYIFDNLANYMVLGKAHVLSDFAVNAVNVLYAHAFADLDEDGIDDEDWTEQGIFGAIAPDSDNYTLHDFSGNGGNYGKLRTKRNIYVQAQFVGDGTASGGFVKPENDEIAEFLPVKKSDLTKNMVSDRINAFLGVDWRLWLPDQLDTLASVPASVEDGTDGVSADSEGVLYNFRLDNTSGEKYNWVNGDEIQFLFKIKDSDGNDIIIDHEGDGTSKTPLYSVWMPNLIFPTVPFVDLWSFTMKDLRLQRGGVTILNNVINVNENEQTVVHVDMPESGNLSIYVTTIDGNIIKRLAMGNYDEGIHNFRWDGTNRSGDSVARGLYFVRVIAPGIDETRKVMCVKD